MPGILMFNETSSAAEDICKDLSKELNRSFRITVNANNIGLGNNYLLDHNSFRNASDYREWLNENPDPIGALETYLKSMKANYLNDTIKDAEQRIKKQEKKEIEDLDKAIPAFNIMEAPEEKKDGLGPEYEELVRQEIEDGRKWLKEHEALEKAGQLGIDDLEKYQRLENTVKAYDARKQREAQRKSDAASNEFRKDFVVIDKKTFGEQQDPMEDPEVIKAQRVNGLLDSLLRQIGEYKKVNENLLPPATEKKLIDAEQGLNELLGNDEQYGRGQTNLPDTFKEFMQLIGEERAKAPEVKFLAGMVDRAKEADIQLTGKIDFNTNFDGVFHEDKDFTKWLRETTSPETKRDAFLQKLENKNVAVEQITVLKQKIEAYNKLKQNIGNTLTPENLKTIKDCFDSLLGTKDQDGLDEAIYQFNKATDGAYAGAPEMQLMQLMLKRVEKAAGTLEPAAIADYNKGVEKYANQLTIIEDEIKKYDEEEKRINTGIAAEFPGETLLEIKERLDNLPEDKKKLQKDINRINENITKVNDSIEGFRKEIEVKENEITAKERSIEDEENAFVKIKEKIHNVPAMVADLRKSITEADGVIANANKTIKEKQKEVDALGLEMKQHQALLSFVAAQKDSYKDNLTMAKKSAQADLAHLNNRIDKNYRERFLEKRENLLSCDKLTASSEEINKGFALDDVNEVSLLSTPEGRAKLRSKEAEKNVGNVFNAKYSAYCDLAEQFIALYDKAYADPINKEKSLLGSISNWLTSSPEPPKKAFSSGEEALNDIINSIKGTSKTTTKRIEEVIAKKTEELKDAVMYSINNIPASALTGKDPKNGYGNVTIFQLYEPSQKPAASAGKTFFEHYNSALKLIDAPKEAVEKAHRNDLLEEEKQKTLINETKQKITDANAAIQTSEKSITNAETMKKRCSDEVEKMTDKNKSPEEKIAEAEKAKNDRIKAIRGEINKLNGDIAGLKGKIEVGSKNAASFEKNIEEKNKAMEEYEKSLKKFVLLGKDLNDKKGKMCIGLVNEQKEKTAPNPSDYEIAARIERKLDWFMKQKSDHKRLFHTDSTEYENMFTALQKAKEEGPEKYGENLQAIEKAALDYIHKKGTRSASDGKMRQHRLDLAHEMQSWAESLEPSFNPVLTVAELPEDKKNLDKALRSIDAEKQFSDIYAREAHERKRSASVHEKNKNLENESAGRNRSGSLKDANHPKVTDPEVTGLSFYK